MVSAHMSFKHINARARVFVPPKPIRKQVHRNKNEKERKKYAQMDNNVVRACVWFFLLLSEESLR